MVEPGSGRDALVVPDLSLVPADPPPEIVYHHRARTTDALRVLWAHREIIYTLAERDFRAQYKQASLGVLWSLLTPVATLLVFIIVFSRLKSFGTNGIYYPLFAFVGILSWSFFASSLNQGGNSLLINKALLSKTQFPRECFPLETMLVNGLNAVLSWIPLAILFVIAGRAPAVATVWVPMFIAIELAFAAGVTLALSGLIIQMRDLTQVVPIIVSLGLFATPVIWPFSNIPPYLQPVYGFFNPVGPVIDGIRRTMLLGRAPHWGPTAAAVVGALFYLAIGYRLFKRFEVHFADIA